MKTCKRVRIALGLLCLIHGSMKMEAQAASMTITLDTAFGNYEPGTAGYNGEYGTVIFEEISYNNADSVRVTVNAGADLGDNPDLHKFYFNTTSNLGLKTKDTEGLLVVVGGLSNPIKDVNRGPDTFVWGN